MRSDKIGFLLNLILQLTTSSIVCTMHSGCYSEEKSTKFNKFRPLQTRNYLCLIANRLLEESDCLVILLEMLYKIYKN